MGLYCQIRLPPGVERVKLQYGRRPRDSSSLARPFDLSPPIAKSWPRRQSRTAAVWLRIFGDAHLNGAAAFGQTEAGASDCSIIHRKGGIQSWRIPSWRRARRTRPEWMCRGSDQCWMAFDGSAADWRRLCRQERADVPMANLWNIRGTDRLQFRDSQVSTREHTSRSHVTSDDTVGSASCAIYECGMYRRRESAP